MDKEKTLSMLKNFEDIENVTSAMNIPTHSKKRIVDIIQSEKRILQKEFIEALGTELYKSIKK